MVNFKRLKALIRYQEKQSNTEQHLFFKQLKAISESELRLKQTSLEVF